MTHQSDTSLPDAERDGQETLTHDPCCGKCVSGIDPWHRHPSPAWGAETSAPKPAPEQGLPVHLFEYEAWHYADQKINGRHDRTLEPLTCDDCPRINPWRDPWPYDAPRREDRVPIVGTLYPRWKYHTAVCVDEDQTNRLWHGLMPTDDELALVRDFIEFQLVSWYYPHYIEKMRHKHPFDIDSGTNTITLIKRAEGDWAYRRMTWEYGPVVIPAWDDPDKLDLDTLLDRINTICDEPRPKWTEWKAGREARLAARAAVRQ